MNNLFFVIRKKMFYNLNLSLKITSIDFYLNMILIPLGFITNLLAIKIFCKKSLNVKTNMGYKHAVLCVFNTFPLVNAILIDNILPHYNIYLMGYSECLCKILNFWRRFAMECPSVQQVFITAMMLYSVKLPSKYIEFQRNKPMKKIVPAMVLILFAINIPSLIGYGLGKDPMNANKNSTSLDCFASDVLTISVTLTTLLIEFFIPFVVMSVINRFMVKYFWKRKNFFSNTNKRRGSRKNFLMSIIIVNTLFFILYSPMAILFLLIVIDYLKGVEVLSQTLLVSYNLTVSLSYLNNVAPFFVHLPLEHHKRR